MKCTMQIIMLTSKNNIPLLRKLCSKLYFKAEAQEIDRILEVFSHKYWNINKLKYGIYKSAGKEALNEPVA